MGVDCIVSLGTDKCVCADVFVIVEVSCNVLVELDRHGSVSHLTFTLRNLVVNGWKEDLPLMGTNEKTLYETSVDDYGDGRIDGIKWKRATGD